MRVRLFQVIGISKGSTGYSARNISIVMHSSILGCFRGTAKIIRYAVFKCKFVKGLIPDAAEQQSSQHASQLASDLQNGSVASICNPWMRSCKQLSLAR